MCITPPCCKPCGNTQLHQGAPSSSLRALRLHPTVQKKTADSPKTIMTKQRKDKYAQQAPPTSQFYPHANSSSKFLSPSIFTRGVWHSSVGCRFLCAERINIWVGALTRVEDKKKKKKDSWSGWATRRKCRRKGGQTDSQQPQTVALTCATHGCAHFTRASRCGKYAWSNVVVLTPTISSSARRVYLGHNGAFYFTFILTHVRICLKKKPHGSRCCLSRFHVLGLFTFAR